METKALEEIGLTKGEIQVYLALLRLGQTTAGPIVDESKVTRSKIYDILERLKNKGLVSHITKESTKYFSAAEPENIVAYLEQKENELKKEKESVRKILPELILQQKMAKHKKIAEVFLGVRGMENAFNVLASEFDSRDTYYAFGAGKGENVQQMQIFFSRLHQKRLKKKVKSKIIFNETSRGAFKSQERSKLVEARYLLHSTPTAINIYKDNTIIAILNKDPITFLIRNKETADSFREYFNAMWKLASK